MLDFINIPASKQMLQLIVIAHDKKTWNSDMETCQNLDTPTYF